jgi:hypothetical protein
MYIIDGEGGRSPPDAERRGSAKTPRPSEIAKNAASSAPSITASAGERQAPTATSPVVIAFPQQWNAERRIELERRAIRHLSALATDLVQLGGLAGSCDGSVRLGPIVCGNFEAHACVRPQRGRQ